MLEIFTNRNQVVEDKKTNEKKLSNHEMNYYRTHVTTILLLISTYLMVEHLWSFGGIDLYDFIGHEWYAIILFVAAIIIAPKQKPNDSGFGRTIKKWINDKIKKVKEMLNVNRRK